MTKLDGQKVGMQRLCQGVQLLQAMLLRPEPGIEDEEEDAELPRANERLYPLHEEPDLLPFLRRLLRALGKGTMQLDVEEESGRRLLHPFRRRLPARHRIVAGVHLDVVEVLRIPMQPRGRRGSGRIENLSIRVIAPTAAADPDTHEEAELFQLAEKRREGGAMLIEDPPPKSEGYERHGEARRSHGYMERKDVDQDGPQKGEAERHPSVRQDQSPADDLGCENDHVVAGAEEDPHKLPCRSGRGGHRYEVEKVVEAEDDEHQPQEDPTQKAQ